MSNNIKYSKDFEYFCVEHIKKTKNIVAYHWDNIPEDVLYDCGYITDYNKHRKLRLDNHKKVNDIGLDAIAIFDENNNKYYAGIQCKLYSKKVPYKDACTWLSKISILERKNNKNTGIIYTINGICNELYEDISIRELTHINVKYEWDNKCSNKIIKENEVLIKRRDYQIDIKEKCISILENNSKIVLNLTCALGKTLLVGDIISIIKPKCIITMAPIKSEVENLYERLPCFLPEYDVLLFDSDNTSNLEDLINKVKTSICDNKSIIIFTTYKSASKISSFIYSDKEVKNDNIKLFLKDAFIIADEVHQIPKNNTLLITLLNNSLKTIYCTATLPKNFIKYIQYDILINEYDFMFAIKNKYIVDYSILIPMISKQQIDIPIKFRDITILQKASFLMKGMLQTGSRRCIVYCQTKEDCKSFVEAWKLLGEEYHGINTEGYRINDDTPFIKRKDILNSFEEGENRKLKIITSCNCLNQAINIIRCDSTFITSINNNSSEIIMYQRFNRASRIDPMNTAKKNNCFIWCDNDFNILEECLRKLKLGLRDECFEQKVKIISQDYDNQDKKDTKDEIVKQKTIIDNLICEWVKRPSMDERIECLINFVNENNRCPRTKEIYEDINIGKLWSHIKEGRSKDIYENILSKNNILKDDYEKVKYRNKNENKENIVLSVQNKCEILLEFVNTNNNKPKAKEVYKNIKIGAFWDSIKHGVNRDIYETILSKNNILKEDYESTKNKRELNKKTVEITPKDRAHILLDFVHINNRKPSLKQVYKDIKIGNFWNHIKGGRCKDIYDNILSKNIILKEDYETVKKKREIKS